MTKENESTDDIKSTFIPDQPAEPLSTAEHHNNSNLESQSPYHEDTAPNTNNDHHPIASAETNTDTNRHFTDPTNSDISANHHSGNVDNSTHSEAKTDSTTTPSNSSHTNQPSNPKSSAHHSVFATGQSPRHALPRHARKAKKPHKPDAGFKTTVVVLLLLALTTAGAGLALSIINWFADDAPVTFNYGNNGNSISFVEGSIADVAAKVSPGVVSIITETRTTGWFGQASTQTSAGTGMIVTKDGYVITNKHVIEGARNISIVLDDGTTYDDVKLIGTDPLNDVAYLKINNASNLPTVALGDSKTISVGQQVIAIGNALGQYQNSITAGIISGTGRALTAYSSDLSSSENLTDMIQTDAAINAGNSGGPLVNAAGEVIGINTATSSEADGIGFAIPISSTKGMLKNIIDNGNAERSYAGVYYVNITPDIAKNYKLPVSTGAYLSTNDSSSAIIKDGPADKAGLKDGDIITKVNGISVGNAGSVSTLMGEYAPGDTVQLVVLRDDQERNINLTLGSYKNPK